jgi:hypothetical protein
MFAEPLSNPPELSKSVGQIRYLATLITDNEILLAILARQREERRLERKVKESIEARHKSQPKSAKKNEPFVKIGGKGT